MLIKVQTFVVEDIKKLSIEDMVKAINICKEENCIVKIMWTPNTYLHNTYFGYYSIAVTADSNAQDAYNSIPKDYEE